MNKKFLPVVFLTCFATMAFAKRNCDITTFHWECDLPVKIEKSRSAPTQFYCGNSWGYLSKRDFARLQEYQRANINMILTINGEHVDSPCRPSYREVHTLDRAMRNGRRR